MAVETVWPEGGGVVYECPEIDPRIRKSHWKLTVDYFNGIRAYTVRQPNEGTAQHGDQRP